MAEISKTTVTKACQLLDVARGYYDRLGETLDEVEQLLGGGRGIAQRMKSFELQYEALWMTRYLVPYIWNYSKDRAQWKRLLKKLSDDELTRRVVNYIKNDDPFYVRSRHPFNVFVAGVNQHADQAAGPDHTMIGFMECQHDPRCRDDAAHTRLKMQEQRA